MGKRKPVLPLFKSEDKMAKAKRTGQLRHRSKKRSELYRQQRIPLVIQLLEERPICQRCNKASSQDIHEIKSRARGGSITDVENLAALCRPCHTWITDHPAAAAAEGWSKHSWE